MTLAEIINKLKDAQAAITAFKEDVDRLVESVAPSPPIEVPITGDTPTAKVPAVSLPSSPPAPPAAADPLAVQSFSSEHSA